MSTRPSTWIERASQRNNDQCRTPVAVVLVLACCVMAGPVVAQGPPNDRPQNRDCEQIRRQDFASKGDWVNARLDCRNENVNVELYALVDQASASEGVFSETQKKSMENLRERAERARKRSMEAGSFKGLGRKQKNDCYVQEADSTLPEHEGNGDGVCTNRGGTKETCAEVIGDDVGDDDGICETMGNRKEVCVEICDTPLNDQDDDNFDDEALEDMEAMLVDTERTVSEANQKMAAGLKAIARARQVLETRAGGENECQDILAGQRFWIYAGRSAFVIGAEAGSVAYDMCSAYGGQTIAGFNTKSVCMVFAAVKGVLNIAVEGWAIAEEILTEKAFDASLECMEQTDAQIASLDAKVGETEQKLEQIEQKVDALNTRLDEIVDLLKTPPGRRPDFPKP